MSNRFINWKLKTILASIILILFPLDGNDNTMMFYGYEDKYNNAYGGLEDSKELLKLIK